MKTAPCPIVNTEEGSLPCGGQTMRLNRRDLTRVLAALSTVAAACTATRNSRVPQGASTPEPIVVGHVEHLWSQVLGEDRPLEIRLPGGYEEETETYPVLVVLDGGSSFSYLASLLDNLAPYHLPEMILVGLPNTHRERDLDPVDASVGEAGEGALRFQGFLEEELIPYLDRRYRTVPIRVLAGHSLAGSFVLQALFSPRSSFQAFVATSPSLQSQPRAIALRARMEQGTPYSGGERFVLLSAGSRETSGLLVAVRDLAEELERRGRGSWGWHVEFREYEGEGHVPVLGFYEGLRVFFEGWFPFEAFEEGDWTVLAKHYEELSARFGYHVRIPLAIGTTLANRILQTGDTLSALEGFRRLAEERPDEESLQRRIEELTARNPRG
jgi:predicted alpha/beta superfamily hydrolase